MQEAAAGPAARKAETGVAGLLGRIAERDTAAAALLLCLALVMFVPGLTNLPPTDRDEARYIQATRQMHESGDYVDIRFQDEKRYKKPVGIYWLQAVATAPFGGASAPVWAFRIPSLLGAIAAVFATWILGRVLFDRRAGLFAALIFSPVVLITVEARLAKTDAVLLACVLLCQIALACAWRAATASPQHAAPRVALLPWPRAMLFWVGLAAGILVKGPVAPMVAGLTGLVLSARKRTLFGLLRMLRPISGVVVLVAMVAPWVLAIAFVSHGQFFNEAIGHDFLGKVAEGQESHGAPPGAYLLFFLVTGWPMAPVLPAGGPSGGTPLARAVGVLLPGMAGAVVARLRGRRDEAAALHAAALSGARASLRCDRRRRRAFPRRGFCASCRPRSSSSFRSRRRWARWSCRVFSGTRSYRRLSD